MSERPHIVVYTDISYRHDDAFGWSYVVVENGAMRTIKAGSRITTNGDTAAMEDYPKSLARRRYNWARLEIRSDYPLGDETRTGKSQRDPWHFVAHYAAVNALLYRQHRATKGLQKPA